MRVTDLTGHRVIRRAIKGQRRFVAGASALGAAHQGCEALVPVVIGIVIDQAVATGSLGQLTRWLLVLGGLFVVLSYSYRFASRMAERASEQAAQQLRIELSQRVLDPRGGAEADRMPGAMVNIATGDAKRVGAVNGVLPFAVAAIAGLVVTAVALLRISLPLGLLVLLGTPPLLWLAHLVGRPLERRSGTEQERGAHASGIAADLVSGLRVLKGIGAESAAVARYRGTSQDSLAAALRAARAQAWHDGGILAMTAIFIAIVALVGAHLAIRGQISVGDLVAAVGLAQYLLTPFQIFSWANGEFAQGRASAARMASVLAAPPAVVGGSGTLPDNVAGAVRLRGVSHGALHSVDIDIPAGDLVGVVTHDPAAATDLLSCLGRNADPDHGSVELDGLTLTDLEPSVIRRSILVAEHDADLFERSLLENVLAGTSTAEAKPSAGIEQALAAAGAHEVAASLPHGVHTLLAERGRSLSGGQRQRVALARALAADPPVLVVHDPTTAVDTVTEAKIACRLAELRSGRTTILVTTSPALLAVADRVLLLRDGTVTEQGSHSELVHTCADYRAAVFS